MDCGTCGTDRAAIVRFTPTKYGMLEQCDLCSRVKVSDGASPDIYLGSKGGLQTEENIQDPKTRQPISFSSKREKAAAMKRLNLEQAPSSEAHHGSRPAFEGPRGKRKFFT